VLTDQEVTTRWRVRDFVWAILGGLFGGGLVLVPLLALGADTQTILVVGSLGQYTGHLLTIWLLARRRGGAASLGFTVLPSDGLYLGLGILLQITVPLLFFPLARLAGDEDAGQAVSEAIRQLTDTGYRVAMAGVVAVLAPITEELMFRGVLLKSVSRTNGRKGLWPTALIFALFHVFGLTGDLLSGLVLTLPTFLIVGLILATVTLRRGRLGPAIFIHSGFNLLAVLVLFLPPELLEQAAGS
jgi:membrane protease YdiL (CAAX protease family)